MLGGGLERSELYLPLAGMELTMALSRAQRRMLKSADSHDKAPDLLK